jgi:hypothetical protein
MVNTCSDAFFDLADMEWVWSKHVDIHLVTRWGWFGQQKLRFIFCPRWPEIGLVSSQA